MHTHSQTMRREENKICLHSDWYLNRWLIVYLGGYHLVQQQSTHFDSVCSFIFIITAISFSLSFTILSTYKIQFTQTDRQLAVWRVCIFNTQSIWILTKEKENERVASTKCSKFLIFGLIFFNVFFFCLDHRFDVNVYRINMYWTQRLKMWECIEIIESSIEIYMFY